MGTKKRRSWKIQNQLKRSSNRRRNNISKHNNQNIDITATKVWDDDNNKAGVRPESIEFTLVVDGVASSTLLYDSLAEAQDAGYVKYDNTNLVYYVDLTSILVETTVNINYYHE